MALFRVRCVLLMGMQPKLGYICILARRISPRQLWSNWSIIFGVMGKCKSKRNFRVPKVTYAVIYRCNSPQAGILVQILSFLWVNFVLPLGTTSGGLNPPQKRHLSNSFLRRARRPSKWKSLLDLQLSNDP